MPHHGTIRDRLSVTFACQRWRFTHKILIHPTLPKPWVPPTKQLMDLVIEKMCFGSEFPPQRRSTQTEICQKNWSFQVCHTCCVGLLTFNSIHEHWIPIQHPQEFCNCVKQCCSVWNLSAMIVQVCKEEFICKPDKFHGPPKHNKHMKYNKKHNTVQQQNQQQPI